MDLAKLEELKAKHGDLYDICGVVCKSPSRGAWGKFRSFAMDDKKKSNAAESLVRDCAVLPAGQELDSLFDKQPALADSIAGKLAELAGVVGEIEAKKL